MRTSGEQTIQASGADTTRKTAAWNCAFRQVLKAKIPKQPLSEPTSVFVATRSKSSPALNLCPPSSNEQVGSKSSYQVHGTRCSQHPLQSAGTLCVKRETGIEKCSGRVMRACRENNERGRLSGLMRGTHAVSRCIGIGFYITTSPRKHLPALEATHSNSDIYTVT
jgi:hypothetical protein